MSGRAAMICFIKYFEGICVKKAGKYMTIFQIRAGKAPEKGFLFLFMYDVSGVVERKSPAGAGLGWR
jgi:hypothetical protein